MKYGNRRNHGARVALFLFTAILAPSSAAAQEYSLYGDLELGATATRVRVPATTVETITTAAVLRLNHLLAYTWGEVVVRHRFTVPGNGIGFGGSFGDDGLGSDSGFTADDGAVTDFGAAGELGVEGDPLRHDLLHAALVMWPAETLTVQVGRHSLPWGMGSAFFPADALHPVRTRYGEDRGFDGAGATWTISSRWTVTGAARVDTATAATSNPVRDLRWAGLLSGYLGRVEIMASAVYQPDTVLRPAVGLSFPLGDLILHGEGSLELSGADATGITDSGTPGAEASATVNGPATAAAPATAKGPAAATGMHYTVYAGIHAITFALEYLYTEQLPPASMTFLQLSPEPDGEGRTAGRHVLYPMISWDGDGRWSADCSALIDLEENRALVRVEVARHILDTLTLAMETILPVDERTGRDRWDGAARVSARVHF